MAKRKNGKKWQQFGNNFDNNLAAKATDILASLNYVIKLENLAMSEKIDKIGKI